jgi:phosphotriesterase-related protein
MAQVETVAGPIDTAELGRTLMHEHIFVISPEIEENYPAFDEDAEVERAVAQLTELKGRGIDTIVDLTVIGTGRCIPRIQRVVERSPVNVIAASGIYTYNEVPKYFHFRGPGTLLGGDELMVPMFVRDVQDGIADTGVKAAILKCAVDEDGLTYGTERVMRAVAKAHRQTGVPISTHTFAPGKVGLDQQRVLEEEGVDLGRVIVGHSGDTTDIDYLEQLVSKGSYIGMDRFGIDVQLPFEDRVNTVAAMCERGHAERMVLSHDAAVYIDWLDRAVIAQATPNWHYNHISDDVIPALRERGVTDEQVDQMLVHNPRAIFEQQGAY